MLPRCDKPALVNARVREKKQVAALCEFHARRAKEIGALIGWELILEKCVNGETCNAPVFDEVESTQMKGSKLDKVVARLSNDLQEF